MTSFFDTIFSRYPVKTHRALEIIPGLISWTLILFPVWGSLFIPFVVAYSVLFFDVYWFYKSFNLVRTAYIASNKIREAEHTDWLKKAKALPDFDKVNHVLVIPNYSERVDKLALTLDVLAGQTLSPKKLHIVLAMEEREETAKEKATILINRYKHIFGSIFASFHPDVEGEVKGKSSNEAYGGRIAYEKLFVKGKLDINFATVSSVDADSIFDLQFFAYLTHSFLTDTDRYHKFWQSAIVFYNNIWKVPAPTRIISFFGSLWRTGVLIQKDRLITQSTYTLSFKLLKDIDFWDTDVIPEDFRIFFKAFFRTQGKVWVEPIFLKTSMDAALSEGFVASLKNKYHQERRWSWGVSDDPLFVKWYFTVPGVPFARKTLILSNVLIDHFLWPVNWFIITIAANIMPLVNPVFSRTTIGYTLPELARIILTATLFSILCLIIIDYRMRPKNQHVSKTRQFLFPLEFVLLPVVGFFLSTLPAIISHTKLMLGKRLEYKVTDKV